MWPYEKNMNADEMMSKVQYGEVYYQWIPCLYMEMINNKDSRKGEYR